MEQCRACGIVLFKKLVNTISILMKNTHILSTAVLIAALFATACNNRTSGSSAPIDSSNQAGMSEAQYTEGNPGPTIDTTVQSRDQYSRDTLGQRAQQTQPTGNGTNSSNTSDARTTSGSANHGDADGDRKR
jgi:hypothetical protein